MSNRLVRILVVEDDETLRYLARRQLTSLGYTCDVAGDGEEALKLVSKQRYAVILMDIQMPTMNGLEAALAIRKFETASKFDDQTPIVAMTANPKKQQCFEAGMNDFMFKPISLEQIKETVARWAA
jgi:two-component system sensor histidine kinase EvgS